MSTGACLGTQGGGCALVILSMSPTKTFKVLVKYSKNVAIWGVKLSACVYPACVPAVRTGSGIERAPRPLSVRTLGGFVPPTSLRVKYTL